MSILSSVQQMFGNGDLWKLRICLNVKCAYGNLILDNRLLYSDTNIVKQIEKRIIMKVYLLIFINKLLL